MASDSITGKAGTCSVAGGTVTITKWSAKVKKEMKDSTDSSNYVSGNNQLFAAQLPGKHNLEGTIEGHWSRGNTPSALSSRFTSDTPVATILKLDQSTTFASFNADLSEFDIGVDVDSADMVDFSCSFMSNGTITYP